MPGPRAPPGPMAGEGTWKQCGLHRAAEYGYGYRVEPIHAHDDRPVRGPPADSVATGAAGWR